MKRVVVLGASGLCGSELIRILAQGEDQVFPLGRRILPEWRKMSQVRPIVMPLLHQVEDFENCLDADVLVHCLGTTRSDAGSAQAYVQVDYEIPHKIFAAARRKGCPHLILLSSLGADPKAQGLYLQTKGKLEAEAKAMGFERLDILRPSLLLGPRKHLRPAEWLMQKIAGPLSAWIPKAYRPTAAAQIAQLISKLIQSEDQGYFVHSNSDFHL